MQAARRLGDESLSFQVLTELPDIAGLASEWDALVERSSCNRAFSSSTWFIATCRHDPSLHPQVLIARRGAVVAGILPLVVTGEIATFANYLSDYSDAIAAQDDLAAARGLVNYARSAPKDYQRIVLPQIRRDSNCFRAMGMIAPRPWIDRSFREIVSCYYLRLPASHDDFLRSKGSRFRKRLKCLHGLAGKRNLAVRELEPDSFPTHELPEAFLSLHLDRQKAGSCFEPAKAQSFVAEVIPRLFRARNIRVCALLDRDRIVAIDLYTMGSNSLCAWNGGFVAEVAHCSPGKILINAGIKVACALGMEEYDFMRGEEAYKTSWANSSRAIGTLELDVAADC